MDLDQNTEKTIKRSFPHGCWGIEYKALLLSEEEITLSTDVRNCKTLQFN